MPTIARPLLLALLVPLAFPPTAGAQGAADPSFDEARAFIRTAMDEADIPSVAVAVARGGEILWAEGFGWADVERRIPATESTMYSLASISKPMTATALMRLVERGRIDLDRPANDYLGDGRIHSPVWDASGATVRRVMSHTAGLPLHWEFFYEGEDHPRRGTDAGIARYGVLVNPPGEVYQYSNLGYGIVERIAELAHGRDLASVLETEVFEPLGMRASAVGTGAGLGDRAAVRYDAEGAPIPFYDFDHRGGSAVYSSVTDLVRFGAYHLGGVLDGQRPILQDSTRRAMQRIATPPAAPGAAGYGLGWAVQPDDNGYLRVSHTGGMPGVSTGLYLFPEADVAVAVVTNRSNGYVPRIAHRLASAVLPGYAETAEERRAEAERAARAETPFTPPGAWLGEWVGTIRTHDDEAVPLTLLFQEDGDVHARIGDGMVTLLNGADAREGRLTGRVAGTIPSEDTDRHPHIVLLDLRMRGGVLSGAATAFAAQGQLHFSLTSYAELRKSDDDT